MRLNSRLMKLWVVIPVVLASLFFLVSTTNASVVYDNITSIANAGTDALSTLGPLYDSFSTGTTAVKLSNVDILVQGDPTSNASFSVDLYSDALASPGPLLKPLGIVSDSALLTSLSVVEFNLASSYLLASGTRYWLGLSDINGSTVQWGWAGDAGGIGVAGELFSNVNGVFDNSLGPYQMRVSGLAVPEPGAFWFLGSGLSCLIGLRRRNSRG